MGFHAYSSPYDWSRIAGFKATAKTVPGGMIDLSVGSPVDPVPSSVQQALVAGADAPNAHGYPVTAGTADLKAAIDTWFRELRGVDLKSINAAAVPTVGSKEAVALMASLLHLGEGDVVVQPAVSYPTYEIGTQLAGATVVKVDDVTDVDSWVNIPNVKAIWINSPCNPTGEVISADWLTDIVAAARRIGAVVLSDECYALMDWRSVRRNTAASSAPAASASAATLNIMQTPGHTTGGICIYVPGVLFSGDTLFCRSIGRTDFYGGDFRQLINSIKDKLFYLPDDTLVLPGHMGQTTIGDEKRGNPFV